MPKTNNVTPYPTDPEAKYGQAKTASTSKTVLTWADVDIELLAEAVDAVVADGAALLLSRTSDGGALVIQVWAGQSRVKWYPASLEELQSVLHLIAKAARS